MKIPFFQKKELLTQVEHDIRNGGNDGRARMAGYESVDALRNIVATETKAETPKVVRDLQSFAAQKSEEAGKAQALAQQAHEEAEEIARVASETRREISETESILSVLQENLASLADEEREVIAAITSLAHTKEIYQPNLAVVYALNKENAWRHRLTCIQQDKSILPARIKTVQAYIVELKGRLVK